MTRKALPIVVLFAVAVLLAGCGSSRSTPLPPTDTMPPHPTATLQSPTGSLLPTRSASPLPEPGATPASLTGNKGDGSIAFYSHRDGNVEIYTMDPDGTDQRRLTSNEHDDYSPAWSPDGLRLAFLSDREDPNPTACTPNCFYQIYVINADGSDEHKLVETEFTVQHPDWHPDGTRLNFDTESNLQGDIYVVNADGSGLQLLIEDGFWADWSPDGEQIVFASNRDGNVEIYVANADGSNQRRLTDNRELDYFPDWSPDGRRIAFARLKTKQIYVINVDGSCERQLTRQGRCENPTWSPDGSHIAFQSNSEGNFEIYTLNVEEALQGGEGIAAKRLTNEPEGDLWPSWGPAPGSRLYLGQTPPGLDVEIFSPGTVSIEEGKEYKITVSPDLQAIFFTRRTPGGRDDRLWHSRLEHGKLAAPELAPFTYDVLETDACFAPDGNRLYYNSARPLPGEEAVSPLPNVWFVDRTETGWSEPRFVGSPLNDYQPVYFSFANDGTLYFTRSSPRGIYYAEPEGGQYGEARRLPDEINDVRNVAHPAVAPDESYIIVDSAYELGGRLVGSLYVSYRRPDGSWTQAVSLHDALKASEADVYAEPRITPDGKYLFFERYEAETDRSDIYWVSTDVVETLRPKAEAERTILTYEELLNGFDANSPVDEGALTPPAGAALAAHTFEGRLELSGQKDGGRMQMVRGELGPDYASLPGFDFEFVQSDGYLIPVRRGLIIADHTLWNLHLEPGRVWQEASDGGFSRASFPFALTVKGGNATFSGTLTFLFDDQRVSKVWYQVTQETTTYVRANLWGLLDAAYHPGPVAGAEQIRANFAAELAARLPVKPIQALAEDYPGVDVSAFGRGITPAHLTWYGVVVDGINYLGGCQTRYGTYPYCESMRATSYSTAKSAFVSVALLRLAQKYGPDVADLLIQDYVPEYATSPGDWQGVTFNHTLDMSTGNYVSAGFMVDDTGEKMGEFFGAQPYSERIAAAFSAPLAADPGTRWVYRTSDTFILTRAQHNYLQTQQGPEADIFQFVVDEVYRPLGLGPGAFSIMRTADDNWQGQAEGGYGLWWVPDDIAKLGIFLNNDGGQIDGEQVLHPGLLAASLQRDPGDRGVQIDGQRRYNNAFWADHYTEADGFDCEFWVTEMQGISGNVVALFPNGVTYYYFSDNQEFTWAAALREADKIVPLCSQ